MKKPYSKYHAKKVVIDGKEFASAKEGKRYKELTLLQRAGIISDLKCQVPFELIPAQYEEVETVTKSGKKKIEKKLIERKCQYIGDFVYSKNGNIVVEDVKGYRESGAYNLFVIKRKLMLWIHGIRIEEI